MNISPQFSIEDDDNSLLRQFTAWLQKVVTNAGIDYYRRQTHKEHEYSFERFEELSPSYENSLTINKEGFKFENEKLYESFSDLNLLRQRILSLIFVEGLSVAETAIKLNCPIKDVYQDKHRAIKKLRNQFLDGSGSHGK
jgi:RNA polymerase sigma factor (sigma-70 family)